MALHKHHSHFTNLHHFFWCLRVGADCWAREAGDAAGGAPPAAVRRRGHWVRSQPEDRGDGHVPAPLPVVPHREPVRRRPAGRLAAALLPEAGVAPPGAGAGGAAAPEDDPQHAPPRRVPGLPQLAGGEARARRHVPGRREQPAVHGGHGLVRGAHPVPERAQAAAGRARGGRAEAQRRVQEAGAAAAADAGQLQLQELGGQPRGLGAQRRGHQRLLPGPALVIDSAMAPPAGSGEEKL